MADQTHRTWDGAGFGDEDEGFMNAEREGSKTRRLVPPPSPLPPPTPPQRSGRGSAGILLGVLITAIVVLGGIIVWRTFVDMTPNDAGSSMAMDSTETAPGTERVDTGIVVRQEQANSTATTETADIPATQQPQNVPQSPARPAVPASRPVAPAAAVPTNSEVASSPKLAHDPAAAVSDRPSTQSPAMPSSAPANVAQVKTRPSMAITPAPKGTPVYVVQVFASPARDDAEEWMQILRSRNVRDGFISEQRIKGETWYRVRFGQYSKRQDAEHAALKVGVEQPWIARIK